jgi:hypothetical protein
MNRGFLLVAGLLLLGSLAACGGDPSSDPVLNRIASLEDCGQVQQEFDTAAASNDRATPGTEQHEVTLGYMQAAQDQLDELNCA